MACNTILFVSRLIHKCFKRKFLHMFADVRSLHKCFCVESLWPFGRITHANVRDVFCATRYKTRKLRCLREKYLCRKLLESDSRSSSYCIGSAIDNVGDLFWNTAYMNCENSHKMRTYGRRRDDWRGRAAFYACLRQLPGRATLGFNEAMRQRTTESVFSLYAINGLIDVCMEAYCRPAACTARSHQQPITGDSHSALLSRHQRRGGLRNWRRQKLEVQFFEQTTNCKFPTEEIMPAQISLFLCL